MNPQENLPDAPVAEKNPDVLRQPHALRPEPPPQRKPATSKTEFLSAQSTGI